MELAIKKTSYSRRRVFRVAISQNQYYRVQHVFAFLYIRSSLNGVPCFQCLPGIVCKIGRYAEIVADTLWYLNASDNCQPVTEQAHPRCIFPACKPICVALIATKAYQFGHFRDLGMMEYIILYTPHRIHRLRVHRISLFW